MTTFRGKNKKGVAVRSMNRMRAERDLALANADGVYARLMPEVERLRAVNGP